MTLLFVSDEPTDKGGEDAGGCSRRSSSASVGAARRLPQTAGPRDREGDQTERTGGQRRESSE